MILAISINSKKLEKFLNKKDKDFVLNKLKKYRSKKLLVN